MDQPGYVSNQKKFNVDFEKLMETDTYPSCKVKIDTSLQTLFFIF